MDQPSKWEDYLHLVEFDYNNGYHSSLNIVEKNIVLNNLPNI